MDLAQLRRFQWAVRVTLAVGVAASVCANVLHARDNLIAQTIAAWPPLALLLTVELVSRVPVHRQGLAAVRILATAAIAGIAAFVSYWHMAAVAARYGESGLAPYLLPLSVDGLVVVASVSLVELAGRVRDAPTKEPDGRSPKPVDTATGDNTNPVRNDTPLAAKAHTGNGHQTTRPDMAPLQVLPLVSASPAPQVDAEPDIVALLPAARAARDALRRHGRSLTRDSLAAQLRRDGHTIRTSRVSALLNLLKNDPPATANGQRPTSSGG